MIKALTFITVGALSLFSLAANSISSDSRIQVGFLVTCAVVHCSFITLILGWPGRLAHGGSECFIDSLMINFKGGTEYKEIRDSSPYDLLSEDSSKW